MRDSSFLLDLEDFLRGATDDPSFRRDSKAYFLRSQWIANYSTKAGPDTTQAAMARQFERWKFKVRTLDPALARRVSDWRSMGFDLVGETDRDPGLYEVDLPTLERLLTASLQEHERAQITKKARSRVVRETPIKLALQSLGIGYANTNVGKWIRLGAPIRVEGRGTRQFYFVDIDELETWLTVAAQRRWIRDKFGAKVLVADATKTLNDIVQKLGINKTEFAEHLGISRAQLAAYTGSSSNLRFVPHSVIEKANELLLSPPKSDNLFYRRKGSPPVDVVREVMTSTGGRLQEAAAELVKLGYTDGISVEYLRSFCPKHEIPVFLKRVPVILPNEEELKKVFESNRFRINRVAQELGVSRTHLRRVLERDFPKIYTLLLKFVKGRSTREDIVQAAEASGFKTAAAAELLDITRDQFRFMLRKHGLADWFDQAAAVERPA